MITNAKNLKDLTIRATDGELGTVVQFYFDDDTWAIRYLMVETGGWLGEQASLDLALFHRQCGLAGKATGCGAHEEAG